MDLYFHSIWHRYCMYICDDKKEFFVKISNDEHT